VTNNEGRDIIGHYHSIICLNTIQRNLRAYSHTLNEAVDLAQNRPLWRLMSTYGAMQSRRCMPEKKKKQDSTDVTPDTTKKF